MKRSELNLKLREAVEFIESMNFKLPPFAFWTPETWADKGDEVSEIRDNKLGWDLTDFGSGDFMKRGLLLFTLRNGNSENKFYTKPYAEKLMIVEEGQETPFHFHWSKMEDIINRGGGNLQVELYNATENDEFDTSAVSFSVDGCKMEAKAGAVVTIKPGESITLLPRQYHRFWGEPGYGRVLLGEVSMVNDDSSDNRFHDDVGRFPIIEDDEEPLYLLCNEYPKAIDR